MYDIPKLFLLGGPDNATLTTSVFIYNQAFSGSYLYNRAAAGESGEIHRAGRGAHGNDHGVYEAPDGIEGLAQQHAQVAHQVGGGHQGNGRSALPIMKPAMATQAIFCFVSSWNSLFLPTILLTDNSKYTMPIMVGLLRGDIYKLLVMWIWYMNW